MDIKLGNGSPDIRSVWESARLQHILGLLTPVQRGSFSSGGNENKELCKQELYQWLEKNPFLRGPHYISVMECALRIPIFIYCLSQLDNITTRESRLLADTIWQHAWWTEKRLSLYSSRGNHTVAESMGLVFAGGLFHKYSQGQRWLKKGNTLIEQELFHQILPDGGPAEQSISYHRFVLDMYWMCCDFLEINAFADCTTMREHLDKGEYFYCFFKDNETVIPIGDSDDGRAPLTYVKCERSMDHVSGKPVQMFASAGYSIISTRNQCRLIFDHGPLGMPPLYNHGHADALSVWLTKNGHTFLCDSGTYRYNNAPMERAYFKGTRAHNTVCIDARDQARQATGFIWSQPYRIRGVVSERHPDGCRLQATHDGYARLKKPVWHTREIRWFDETNFLIMDRFTGRGKHDFELNFHLHPHAKIEHADGWWMVVIGQEHMYLKLISDNGFKVHRGETDPLLGWGSPSYGIKEPCFVLQALRHGCPHEVRFITAVCTDEPLSDKYLLERLNSC